MYDIFSIVAFISVLIIIMIILGVAMASNFIPNSPSRSRRAKEMRDLAISLGLNYEAQERKSIKQKLFDYTRKTNIISGRYGNEDILIYDYKTITAYSAAMYYAQDPKSYTYINGSYLKPNLSIENIEKIIDGTLSESEMLNRNDKMKLNFQLLIILLIFIISLDAVAFIVLYEVISLFLLIQVLILASVVLIYIAYMISKKAYTRTHIR